MSNKNLSKPIGRKAYGSIGHLPTSRLGPGDHAVHHGQARICTERLRDRHDRVIVTEKLDGSCCAVALIGDSLVPLTRSGFDARTSQWEQHRMFAQWVSDKEDRFRSVLRDGELVVGEWLAQAHGTKYDLTDREPFGVFDLMLIKERTRASHDQMRGRIGDAFAWPHIISDGPPISVVDAMAIHANKRWPSDSPEGLVYRVERHGQCEFLAKFVRPDKQDGIYLPEISGLDPVWNWQRPQ